MANPRKLRCTVESLTDHGGRVYTVDLATDGLVPAFHPGQFLHLTVDDYDPAGFWPESRVFSIASSPADRRHLRVCYSVKGRYTTKMELKLKVGSEVWVKLPYGEFVIDDASDAVLIAGGTGISAFTAFIEALNPESPRKIWLAYGARNSQLLLYQESLLSRLAQVPGFSAMFFTEAADAEFTSRLAALPKPAECLSGRINVAAVLARVLEPAGKVFYLSGPPVMLSTLSADLKSQGLPADHVRTDAWE